MHTDNCGFTIIEIMLAIAVAAVLMSLAIPNFQMSIRNNCMATSANLFVTSLQYARSEAIKRRQPVMVAAGAPGQAPGDSTNEWGGGWHVWAEGRLTDGSIADDGYTPGDELRVSTPACAPMMDETNNVVQFTYQPNGFIDRRGALEICMDKRGERGRELTVSPTGRPRVTGNDDLCSS